MKDAITVYTDKDRKYKTTIMVQHILTMTSNGTWIEIKLSDGSDVVAFHTMQELVMMIDAKV